MPELGLRVDNLMVTQDRTTDQSAKEASEPARGLPVTILRPSRGWSAVNVPELWEYRELIWFLTWRDLKVRYKQTILGVSWAIIQPFSTMVVFSLFFGKLAGMPSDGVPYPLFSFAALVPWAFFAQSLSQASSSVLRGKELIRKVYFPRLAIPIAAVL